MIVACVFLLLFFGLMRPAEASNNRPPERGAVEQIQNQDVYVEGDTTTTNNDIATEASASASTDGNTQTLGISQNYAERAVKAVLGGAYADSDPGSTSPCLESTRGWGIGGALSWTGRTKLNERCWYEYQENASHIRSQEAQKLDLEKAKLLHELGYISEAARMLGAGGDKYTPSQLQSMEKEVAEYRKHKVHGDILK